MAPVVTQSIMLLPLALLIHRYSARHWAQSVVSWRRWSQLALCCSHRRFSYTGLCCSHRRFSYTYSPALSVTPVKTTTFRSGLILSIFPGIYEVFLLAYAQISSVETPLVAGRHTDGNTPLDSSLSRGDQTEQPGLVAGGGLGAACHPIVCNH